MKNQLTKKDRFILSQWFRCVHSENESERMRPNSNRYMLACSLKIIFSWVFGKHRICLLARKKNSAIYKIVFTFNPNDKCVKISSIERLSDENVGHGIVKLKNRFCLNTNK